MGLAGLTGGTELLNERGDSMSAWRMRTDPRVVSARREISAAADKIFQLIADPAEQPRWDGNDNLRHAAAGRRAVARLVVTFVAAASPRTRRSHT